MIRFLFSTQSVQLSTYTYNIFDISIEFVLLFRCKLQNRVFIPKWTLFTIVVCDLSDETIYLRYFFSLFMAD